MTEPTPRDLSSDASVGGGGRYELRVVYEFVPIRFPRSGDSPEPTLGQIVVLTASLRGLFLTAWLIRDARNLSIVADAGGEGEADVTELVQGYPGDPYVRRLRLGSLDIVLSIPEAFAAAAGAMTALVVLAERLFTMKNRIATENARLQTEKQRYLSELTTEQEQVLDSLAESLLPEQVSPEDGLDPDSGSAGRFRPVVAQLEPPADKPN